MEPLKCSDCKAEIPKDVKKCMHCGAKQGLGCSGCCGITTIAFFALLVISSLQGIISNSEVKTNENIATQPNLEVQTVETTEIVSAPDLSSLDPVTKIETLVGQVGNFEVTVWTMSENFADSNSKPPFEVIVNTSPNQLGCVDAKSSLFQIMKNLYTDTSLNGKIARIKFTAWGQLKGSLGSSDLGFDWDTTGPSNLWSTLQQYRSYEDESSSMNQRTYGVPINSDCD